MFNSLYFLIRGLILTLLIAFSISATDVSIDNLIYLTEQYPPHNYEENGTLKGVSVEILELMWKRMGLDKTRNDISLVPWARGYSEAMTNPRVVLFGTGRTKEREEYFKFVGPYYSYRIVLISRVTTGLEINSPDELKKYRIGSVREDIAEQILVNSFGMKTKDLDRSVLSSSLVQKLNVDRINIAAMGEDVFFDVVDKLSMNKSDFEIVYVLSEGYSCYAFNKSVPDEIIFKFQSAFDAVMMSGDVVKILDKYGL